MWLLARRSWFWAGLTAALAFLVWQPYAVYPVLAIVLPGQPLAAHTEAAREPRRRSR